jgi:hypothetical protein
MLRLVFAAAGLVLATSQVWAQTAPQTPFRVAQAGSCSTWNATCNSRCTDDACRKNVCGSKMTSCLSSGCWTESGSNGGARHCGLAKR